MIARCCLMLLGSIVTASTPPEVRAQVTSRSGYIEYCPKWGTPFTEVACGCTFDTMSASLPREEFAVWVDRFNPKLRSRQLLEDYEKRKGADWMAKAEELQAAKLGEAMKACKLSTG